MKTHYLYVLATVAFLLLLSVCNAMISVAVEPPQKADSDSEPYVGWIEEIKGSTHWMAKANSAPIALDPKRDRYRRLYAGERIKAEKDGLLRLNLYGKITELKGPSVWYPIPLVRSTKQDARVAAMRGYARIGGRERAAPSQFYSPAPDSATEPDRVIFRWTPRTGMHSIALMIQTEDGAEVWKQTGIEETIGHLESELARKALMKFRADGGQGTLVLALSDHDNHDMPVSFTLLSEKSEQELEDGLKEWDKEPPGLLRCLGRAAAYQEHRLFAEAAAEYDTALEAAPESHDLLIAAIMAQRKTGNAARERELMKRFPTGTRIPD